MSQENKTKIELTDCELMDVAFALSRMEEQLREDGFEEMADRHETLHNTIVVSFADQREGDF